MVRIIAICLLTVVCFTSCLGHRSTKGDTTPTVTMEIKQTQPTNEIFPADSLLAKYDSVGTFCEGRAVVWLNGKYGYIDENGSERIPVRYYYEPDKYTIPYLTHLLKDETFKGYNDFSCSIATVSIGSSWGAINRSGDEVIPCEYDYAGNLKDGSVAVIESGKIFITDSTLNKTPVKLSRLRRGGTIIDGKLVSEEELKFTPWTISKEYESDQYIHWWYINKTAIPSIYREGEWFRGIGRIWVDYRELYINGYGEELSPDEVIDNVADRLGILPEEQSSFRKACKKYEAWRKDQIRLRKFSHFNSMNMDERYSLPGINALEMHKERWYDTDLEVLSFNYNDDGIPDYLFEVKPIDTQLGCGLSWHKPVYFLTYSLGSRYIDGSHIIGKAINCLERYFDGNEGFYDLILIKDIVSKQDELILKGEYLFWIEYGPDSDHGGSFISHLPKKSGADGYTCIIDTLYRSLEITKDTLIHK